MTTDFDVEIKDNFVIKRLIKKKRRSLSDKDIYEIEWAYNIIKQKCNRAPIAWIKGDMLYNERIYGRQPDPKNQDNKNDIQKCVKQIKQYTNIIVFDTTWCNFIYDENDNNRLKCVDLGRFYLER